MIRIKNLRPSRLFITDAGLKLLPGQVVAVESLSRQTESLIARGYVAQLTEGQKEKAQPEPKALPPVPKDYENLHAPESIEYIERVDDPQILKTILKEEPRKTVLEAINQRLRELEG
jgi:hypothetical protein